MGGKTGGVPRGRDAGSGGRGLAAAQVARTATRGHAYTERVHAHFGVQHAFNLTDLIGHSYFKNNVHVITVCIPVVSILYAPAILWLVGLINSPTLRLHQSYDHVILYTLKF